MWIKQTKTMLTEHVSLQAIRHTEVCPVIVCKILQELDCSLLWLTHLFLFYRFANQRCEFKRGKVGKIIIHRHTFIR